MNRLGNQDRPLKKIGISKIQETLQEISSASLNKKRGEGEAFLLSDALEKHWKIIIFLLSLCLPLSLQVFFHPGTTADYRIVVISLQLITIITAISCFSLLYLEISPKLQILILLWLGWGWVCAVNSSYPIVSYLRQMV